MAWALQLCTAALVGLLLGTPVHCISHLLDVERLQLSSSVSASPAQRRAERLPGPAPSRPSGGRLVAWIDGRNPNHTSTCPAAEYRERAGLAGASAEPRRVPYTVWSFGEMPYDAKASFGEAARKSGSQGGFVWNMDAVDSLLEMHPEWQRIWPQIKRRVMKSDISRYLVAYEMGGFYTDYDVRVKGPAPAGNWSLLLQIEKKLQSVEEFGRDAVQGREKPYLVRIAQYFFAAEPKHPFFSRVLDLALNRTLQLLRKKWWLDKDVLWASGPDVLTTVYHDHFEDDASVLLLPLGGLVKHLSQGRWKGHRSPNEQATAAHRSGPWRTALAKAARVPGALQWVHPNDVTLDASGAGAAAASATSLAETFRDSEPRQIPFTVWTFGGEVGRKPIELFGAAARSFGSPGGFILHPPVAEVLLSGHERLRRAWPEIERPVVRGDLLRYLAAYEWGGLYIDYDVKVSNKGLPAGNWTLVLQSDGEASADKAGDSAPPYSELIAPYFFAVQPRHHFFAKVLEESVSRVEKLLASALHNRTSRDWHDSEVQWATGSEVLSAVYHDFFRGDPSVILTDPRWEVTHYKTVAWRGHRDLTQPGAREGPQAAEFLAGLSLEWVTARDPNTTRTGSMALFKEKTAGLEAGRVPFTVWARGEVPQAARRRFAEAARMWKSPGGFLWHVAEAQALVKQHSEWSAVWPQIRREVMKSDVLRYLIAYDFGGTYVDYDVKVGARGLPEGVLGVVLQMDKNTSASDPALPYTRQIAPYFFAANPKHEYFRLVLELSLSRVKWLIQESKRTGRKREWFDKDVTWATGHDVLSTVYQEHFQDDPEVILLRERGACTHLAVGSWRGDHDRFKQIQ